MHSTSDRPTKQCTAVDIGKFILLSSQWFSADLRLGGRGPDRDFWLSGHENMIVCSHVHWL